MKVIVVDEQEVLEIPEEDIRGIARFALEAEGRSGDVEVALVDDAAIAELHERFLAVAGPTDVITFPHNSVSEDGDCDSVFPEGEEESLGEIVISTETACRQAPEYARDPAREVLVYVVHGILHLLGYDDRDDAGRRRMDTRQNEILELWEKTR